MGLSRLAATIATWNTSSFRASLRFFRDEHIERYGVPTHIDAWTAAGMPPLPKGHPRWIGDKGEWIAADLHRVALTCDDWYNDGVKEKVEQAASRPVTAIASHP